MLYEVITMLFAVAVNIILGFGGLRPLGMGTFFGFSSYAYLFLVVRAHLPLAAALPIALGLSIRITSYNVCYTKLLRLVFPLASSFSVGPVCEYRLIVEGARKEDLADLGVAPSFAWVLWASPFLSSSRRITSYNVCYTKLLRSDPLRSSSIINSGLSGN